MTVSRRTRAQVHAHVVPGRCVHCGHQLITWTPERIVEAALEFTMEYGRVPKATDWHDGAADHPARTTVCNLFGSWNGMLNAAGLTDRAEFERDPIWTREMVVAALLDFRVVHGRWPVWRDWAVAKGRTNRDRPSAWVVRKLFGSWSEAMRYAAGETDPSLPGQSHLKCGARPLDVRAGVRANLPAPGATVFATSGEAEAPAAQQRRVAA